jgi:hypothetical protein
MSNRYDHNCSIASQLSELVFQPAQLRSEKNNVRPRMWEEYVKSHKEKGLKDSGGGTTLILSFWRSLQIDAFFTFVLLELDQSMLSPTPFYNMAIMEDASLLVQHNVMCQAIAPFNSIRDAVILMKVPSLFIHYVLLTGNTVH